ncbi:MAG: protein translocase subunit SecD [Gammaproteobacteria bacterium]|nr:protein translocase subunit SecD [Gammaproteobacteria bacterium]
MFPSRWKLAGFAAIILSGCLIAAPNLLSPDRLASWPAWLPTGQLSLGLDLRGGAHLVLEMDPSALAQEQLQGLLEATRNALRKARLQPGRARIDGNRVTVAASDAGHAGAIQAALADLRGTVPSAGGALLPGVKFRTGADHEVILELTEAALLARQEAALEQSLEVVRRRVDELGVAEPTVQRYGATRILVQLPGVQDPASIRQLLGSTARLSFHRVRSPMEVADPSSRLPAGYAWLPSEDGLTRYAVAREPLLQGGQLAEAGAGFDTVTREPIVTFRFDSAGARRFADITTRLVGEPFAVVLDGKVLTAPVIREPITAGSGQISGNFSVAEASTLAALLRAGALPVPLDVIEERTVGADLGADAIRAGAVTGAIGLGLVLCFMALVYGAWGMVANLALLMNVVLTVAALTLLGATLTLPGIAGIVLGIGLAVDANVLINERIREETRRGRPAATAFQAGFKKAYATIVDSNVTTLIATTLLFWVGTGPVRGFAVTMGIGIAMSMFTAVSVVRAIMASWLKWRRPRHFPLSSWLPLRIWEQTPAYAFMRARFVGLGTSLVLSALSAGLFINPGLNYGIDFVGGIVLEATTPGEADLSGLREVLGRLGLGEVSLQEFGSPETVLVRVERQAGDDAAQLVAAGQVRAAILGVAPGASIDRVEVVGPKISGELADLGLLAVLLASVAMFFYVWVRFDWHFAVGAIITLVLDVTKAVGFFALTGLEFNLSAIAALLTLIGYSVNDKVVVYDRMREKLRNQPGLPLREVVDRSINETLTRSLYTSLTTLLAMLPMAVWGGPTVASFAVPMVFGIVVATSSSIFIAAPILLVLGERWVRTKPPVAIDAQP